MGVHYCYASTRGCYIVTSPHGGVTPSENGGYVLLKWVSNHVFIMHVFMILGFVFFSGFFCRFQHGRDATCGLYAQIGLLHTLVVGQPGFALHGQTRLPVGVTCALPLEENPNAVEINQLSDYVISIAEKHPKIDVIARKKP
jgi:hypothetical protein